MYKSKEEAVEALHKHFPERHWPVLENALIQVIGFEKAESLKGGTRIGGTPDMPESQDWPIRKAGVPNEFIQKMLDEEGTHKDFIKLHIEIERPYESLAQIDLSQISRFENLLEGLPKEGRLLFFYDGAVGPWDSSKGACKVIWDHSQTDTLNQTFTPQSLIDLAKKANEQETAVMDEAMEEFLDELEEQFEEDDDEGNVCEIESLEPTEVRYWGPEQAMQLVTHWRLPADSSLEFEKNADLVAIRSEDYDGEDEDEFDYYDAEWEFHEHLHGEDMSHMGHQFLGSPCPEQSDPRSYAAIYYVTGQQFLDEASEAERRQIDEVEKDMYLLLQIDNAGYQQQDYIEGTIYFIIHKDDLAERKFEETIAIYQQT